MKYKSYVLFLSSASVLSLCGVEKISAQSMPGHPMHIEKSTDAGKHIFLSMMDTMMVNMDAPKASGKVETDFYQQMLPHHQGAIDMAKYEIAHGRDFEMIQLAKSILAEQQSESSQMWLWLKVPNRKENTSSDDFIKDMQSAMFGMMEHLPVNEGLKDIDRSFAAIMIPHHQAAVAMAKAVLKYGSNDDALAFAKQIISNEQIEIEQMITYLQ